MIGKHLVSLAPESLLVLSSFWRHLPILLVARSVRQMQKRSVCRNGSAFRTRSGSQRTVLMRRQTNCCCFLTKNSLFRMWSRNNRNRCKFFCCGCTKSCGASCRKHEQQKISGDRINKSLQLGTTIDGSHRSLSRDRSPLNISISMKAVLPAKLTGNDLQYEGVLAVMSISCVVRRLHRRLDLGDGFCWRHDSGWASRIFCG